MLQVLEQVNKITLNAIDLHFNSVILKGSEEFVPSATIKSDEDETATLNFDKIIPPGDYFLNILFKGEINDTLRGFYRSKYVDEKGLEKYAAVTQFCATDARRCFPCWDEPALKATFNISLTVPKHLVALSNMPVIQQTQELGELIRYDFDKTPIMSTYLVAVVVGEYDYVENKSSDGVLVRVYTPKGKKEQGIFALEVASKILPFYKDYFNIAYPLPKIDLVTVADFSFGAMENWGLVTYRETRLLVDPKNTSAASKQTVAVVVGHELAHQWFGNLVTMEWWTHLWLNEGYASFVPNLCIDYLFPDYQIWTQFVSSTYIKALELDGLKNSHPIEIPINNPYELFEIFDNISYNKGASIIRMLHSYIGDEDFRKGMNIYLTRHQYKNTHTEDLWVALEEASNKPINKIMSTWTKQLGYPVISVSKKDTTNGTLLMLSQEKFTADGSKWPEDLSWKIPITISSSNSKEIVKTILETKETEVLIPKVGENDWVKINPGTVGFYRTKYPSEMLEKLIPAIEKCSIPALDRLGILDDLFAMVKAGHTNTVEILKVLRAFEEETDYNVWYSILNILGNLGQLLAYTDANESFQKYQKILLKKVSCHLGWDGKPSETHLDTLLRGLILGRLASLQKDNIVQEANMRFSRHITSEKVIPADLRTICYKAVLGAGGYPEFEQLLQLYRSTDLQEEKDRIIGAFGVAKDSKLMSKVLEFSMSDEVRPQDTPFVLISVASSRAGRDLAWNYFKGNSKKISERISNVLLTRLVKQITQDFSSEEKAAEVERYFRENEFPGTERSVQQAVETIRLNSKWLQRDTQDIQEYLKKFV